MRLLAFCSLSIALLPLSAFAELKWDQVYQTVDAAIGDTEIHAVYRFTNESGSTQTISDIRHSCGCTTSELDSRVIPPGGTGEIVVGINLAGLSGSQAKTVSIYYEGSEEPQVLFLATEIPVAYELTPNILAWSFRGKPVMRRAELRFHAEHDWNFEGLSVEVQDRDDKKLKFEVALKMGSTPQSVYVEVLPKNLQRLGHVYLVVSQDDTPLGEVYLIVN